MAEIAILKNNYYFNFDNGWLYNGKQKLIEISGREADLLRCLCENPNQYLSFDRISDMIAKMDHLNGRGLRLKNTDCLYFSRETIKPWKSNLLSKHEVFRDKSVIDSKRNKGYIYYGQPITKIEFTELSNIQHSSSLNYNQPSPKALNTLPLYLDTFAAEYYAQQCDIYGISEIVVPNQHNKIELGEKIERFYTDMPETKNAYMYMKDVLHLKNLFTKSNNNIETVYDCFVKLPASSLVYVNGLFILNGLYQKKDSKNILINSPALLSYNDIIWEFVYKNETKTTPSSNTPAPKKILEQSMLNISLILDGDKFITGPRHIAYTIEKGKVFDFNIIGIILPLGNNSFSIKPIFVELVLPM